MKLLEYNIAIRNNFKKLIEDISIEDINKIPEGYSNNILWNYGHAVATQNVLLYKLSGLPFSLPDEFVATYRKGTFPPTLEDPKAELEVIHLFSEQSIAHLRKDLASYKFQEFDTYETSFGALLENHHDAMQFNNMHESMHFGYCIALKKTLGY